MTFVYAIGNNDLWPNNKNSVHNFEVRVFCGWVCINNTYAVCCVCVYTPRRAMQASNNRLLRVDPPTTHHHAAPLNKQALYDLMAQHCPDTCAIFQGTEEDVAANKKLFREGGYYVFRWGFFLMC